MANPSVVINGVTYQSCPEVDIPKSGSGMAKYYYTGDANITSADVLTGKTGFGANGEVDGGMANNGATGGTISTKAGSVAIPAGYTTGGTVALDASAVTDLVSGNLLSGKTVLGVSGGLTVPSISQDATTKVLSIS
jgi:hypothetical protein